jgi:hypothetical protein
MDLGSSGKYTTTRPRATRLSKLVRERLCVMLGFTLFNCDMQRFYDKEFINTDTYVMGLEIFPLYSHLCYIVSCYIELQ